MPLIETTYTAPRIFRNAHFSTIYASSLRKVAFSTTQRNRIELEDGDFLDLDRSYSSEKNNRLVILLHGLAGNAQRPYMKAMARIFKEDGWDTAAMNLRGCSEEMNRLYRSYNAGATEDLEAVISHILKGNQYDEIVLVGFSLGGNLMLKYLGENVKIPSEIKSAVAVSTPCDLGGSLEEISKPRNIIYSKRFIRNLKKELFKRHLAFPERITKKEIDGCKTLRDIDELYTSRAHGYKNAADYYQKCSSLQFLPNVQIPTLIINAENDSFLSATCYPIEIAENSETLHLEIPAHGGHVGFIQNKESYYHEERALEFIQGFSQ
ncbi:YheT family hydrolase [Salegentibacter sediminis]|uniref:YheT family hydrolase n=1 Tax=Salegentibacter sediminis TaxID=1930251 RepID=UPI0009BFA548|nr:alpha/beta fold hydrolase [Salegentibacter sediminis]